MAEFGGLIRLGEDGDVRQERATESRGREIGVGPGP
jgi:hypothetical protein